MEKKNRKISKKKLIISIIVACILIPVVAYSARLAYILYFRENPTFVDSNDSTEGDELTDIPDAEKSGIDNIVLFGVDNRTASDHGRTDSIIIATIDKNSKVIKLSSIMRDLYVNIGTTNSMNRVNAAYSLGGPELALKTLNRNFGLDLKYYAIIDFRGFQDLVDQVGGIDVDVKDYEVNEINFYIREVNGKNSTLLKSAGFQNLNGQQALSFARIRKVGNGDYERTERQRIVLNAIAEKAKKVNIAKLPSLMTTLASYVQTNVPMSKILGLGLAAYGFDGRIEQMRIPVDGYFAGQNVNGASVLVPDIKANAQFLKEFIYGVNLYANKDVPAYMENNFHMDDSVASAKPKPNIPDYSTPEISLKPEEQENEKTPTIAPGVTVPPTPTPTGTGDGDNPPDGKPTEPTPTPKPTPPAGPWPTPTPKPVTP